MDRITKALKRLPKSQCQRLLKLITQIESGDMNGLDVVKLKGYEGLYRVRRGELRLIIKRVKDEYRVLILESRSETTYSKLGSLDD